MDGWSNIREKGRALRGRWQSIERSVLFLVSRLFAFYFFLTKISRKSRFLLKACSCMYPCGDKGGGRKEEGRKGKGGRKEEGRKGVKGKKGGGGADF